MFNLNSVLIFFFFLSGLHDYEYVLAPRMRGFKISLEHLWDHIDAVYDVTIAYSHTVDPDTGKRMKSPGMPGK